MAFWLFQILVWPLLAFFVFMMMLLFNLSDVIESCKKKRFVARQFKVMDNERKKQCYDRHYKDEAMIATLSTELDEHGLFDRTEAQECWALLSQSKGQLAPMILLENIKDRIVSLSGELQV